MMKIIVLPFRAMLALVIIVAMGPRAAAQLVSGEVFLQGSYVETGLASNGAFGSVNAAPSGYHARSGSGGSSKNLGFVADPDKDGWTVGTPAFFGDYFLASLMGYCQEGWRVQIGTNIYEAWRGYGGITTSGISGSNTGYTSIGTTRAGTWEGSIGNLKIRQVTSLDASGVFVVVNVYLKNTGSTTLASVYYERDVNPENENNVVSGSDFYNTDNRVEFKLPNTQNKTLVSATGRTYGAYMGIGSKDCRAKGFISNNFDPTLTPAKTYAETAPYTYNVSTVANQDLAIGIVYDLGNIAAGDSTTLSFAYVLKAADLDSAFAQVQHGFVHNATTYQSKDTLRICPGTATLSISNPGDYSWTWSPATGLSTITGTTVSVTAGPATTITYRAIGATLSSGCGTTKDTIYLNVKAASPDTPLVTTPGTYCQNATAAALTASGTGLKWYTAPTGGTGSATAPTPSTTTPGSTTYYVSQTSASGCESGRSAIVVTVNAQPGTPVVSSPVLYCTGATATALSATGTGLKWYTAPTGGTASTTAPTPSTAVSGSTTYYVSQTSASGCESGRSAIVVTVNTTPGTPVVTTPVVYCQYATPGALTATGTSLTWYTVPSGGTGSTTAPTPSTASAGTTTYYVTQTAVASGCSSLRASIDVVVNATPDTPLVSPPVVYCQNAASVALTATGFSLKWYTAATGGTASSTAPTPSTSSAGSTSYYVSQTSALGCESKRSRIVVTVIALPAKPTVTTPVTYCQYATPAALTATGTSLTWYTVPSGGTGSATAPTPSTASTGTTTYYVTQTAAASGCSSLRAPIDVVVNATPDSPLVITPVVYCQNDAATVLTATGTGLKWYTAATGGTGSSTAPTPATSTAGSTSYYVSQTSGLGCESKRSRIVVTVNALPAKPVTTTVTYCQHATPVALTATGTGLTWYTVASGGTGSITAPTPSTATVGTKTYYVTQTASVTGCTSLRASLDVVVNGLPAAPTVTTPANLCQGVPAVALTATGTTLLWYTAATGGTGSSIAPVPPTLSLGATSYYVSQTNALGCEGPRAEIVAVVNAIPAAPVVVTPLDLCIGVTPAPLSATGTNLKWYAAGSGGTGSATATVPNVSVTGSFAYYVSQTSLVGCESPRAVINTTVHPSPVLTLSTPHAPDFVFCEGAAVTLKANAPTAISYQWLHASVDIAGAIYDTTMIGTNGNYGVRVTDIYGCQSTKTAFVFKDTLPKPSLSPTSVQMCRGVNIMLYCSPAHAGYTYLWSKDGLLMGGPAAAAVAMSEAGIYRVVVTDYYGCTSTTNAAAISAYPAVVKPVITRYDKTLRLSAIYASQQWFRNNVPIGGATANSYTMSFDGMYYAQVYDGNGCTTMSDTINITALGIPAVNGNHQQLRLYPNPTQGRVTIETGPDKIRICVTDVTGREVLRRQDVKEIDLVDLADGMYLFTITNEDGLLIGQGKIQKLSK